MYVYWVNLKRLMKLSVGTFTVALGAIVVVDSVVIIVVVVVADVVVVVVTS